MNRKSFMAELRSLLAFLDAAERERNPRAASVRLRGVELIRPLPERWRRRFAEQARGNDDVRDGRGPHGAHGAHGRRGHRTKARG